MSVEDNTQQAKRFIKIVGPITLIAVIVFLVVAAGREYAGCEWPWENVDGTDTYLVD
jgi:hypothetical protein